MLRRFVLAAGLMALAPRVIGQSLGLMAGASWTNLRAAGLAFDRRSGPSMGVFVPVYVNDRLVLRAECGIAFYPAHGTTDRDPVDLTEASFTALGRYYLHRRFSLGLGMQGARMLNAPAPLALGHELVVPGRTDIRIVFAAAYRWSDRIETGFRFGQGLPAVAEAAAYGRLHRRTCQFLLSYLLHGDHVTFAARRKWHSGLAMTQRY